MCDSLLACCWPDCVHAGMCRVLKIVVRSQQDVTMPISMHLRTVIDPCTIKIRRKLYVDINTIDKVK